MMHPIGPLTAVACAAALSLTVTADAAAQATAGAADTAGPQAAVQLAAAPAENRYTLVDVGGKTLPVETEKEWRCREEVTAGTLVLREDGRWRLETTIRETCGSRTRIEHEDEDGIYRTEGTTIHFFDEDGHRNQADWKLDREIDLDELDRGTMSDGGTLTVRLADDKTMLAFRSQGQ